MTESIQAALPKHRSLPASGKCCWRHSGILPLLTSRTMPRRRRKLKTSRQGDPTTDYDPTACTPLFESLPPTLALTCRAAEICQAREAEWVERCARHGATRLASGRPEP